MKEKIKFQKGFIPISLLAVIITGLFLSYGVGYGININKQINKALKEVDQLVGSKNYDKANNILDNIEGNWLIKNLNFKKGQINEIKLTIEKDRYKALEGKLTVAEIEIGKGKEAVEEAEGKAIQETIKRSQAEARAKQEEFEKNLKEQQLSAKETEEKKNNTDNDGDGLTYGRELELETSDWNTDSDGDGVPDNLDLHPTGEGRNIAQNFQWEYEGKTWTRSYPIHEDWYEYYKNKNQPRSQQGVEYVTSNDPFIKAIANKLKGIASTENYHLTSFLVSFVQGLSYVEDYYTSFDEYPKYPIETFVERNGDCEDTSYLFASLAQSTGVGVALVQFHDHMGVGIKTVHSQSGYYYPIGDNWYYYYETTGTGWQVGDLPKEYIYEKAKITLLHNNAIYYVIPRHIKTCYTASDFSGYYFDGENYYSDSQCNNIAYCLSYKGFYYNVNTKSFYYDSNCSMIMVAGCYKSTYNPGYFFDDNNYYYSDSRCLNRAYTTTTTWLYIPTTSTTTTTVPSTTTTTTTVPSTTTTTTTVPSTTTTTTTVPSTTTTTTIVPPTTTTTTVSPTTTTTTPLPTTTSTTIES